MSYNIPWLPKDLCGFAFPWDPSFSPTVSQFLCETLLEYLFLKSQAFLISAWLWSDNHALGTTVLTALESKSQTIGPFPFLMLYVMQQSVPFLDKPPNTLMEKLSLSQKPEELKWGQNQDNDLSQNERYQSKQQRKGSKTNPKTSLAN